MKEHLLTLYSIAKGNEFDFENMIYEACPSVDRESLKALLSSAALADVLQRHWQI